jgi:hypothetical protein
LRIEKITKNCVYKYRKENEGMGEDLVVENM